MLIYALAC